MFKATLKKLDGTPYWFGKFESLEDAQSWASRQLLKDGRLQESLEVIVQDISSSHNLEQEKIAAKEYLGSTDWYVIRLLEREIAIPSEVASLRLAAVAKLNE